MRNTWSLLSEYGYCPLVFKIWYFLSAGQISKITGHQKWILRFSQKTYWARAMQLDIQMKVDIRFQNIFNFRRFSGLFNEECRIAIDNLPNLAQFQKVTRTKIYEVVHLTKLPLGYSDKIWRTITPQCAITNDITINLIAGIILHQTRKSYWAKQLKFQFGASYQVRVWLMEINSACYWYQLSSFICKRIWEDSSNSFRIIAKKQRVQPGKIGNFHKSLHWDFRIRISALWILILAANTHK